MDVEEKLRELMKSHDLTDDMLDQECSTDHDFSIEKFISWRDVGPRLPGITHDDINTIDIDTIGGQQAKRRRLMQVWHVQAPESATYRVLIEAMLKERKVDEATKVCKLLKPIKGWV